MSTLDDRVGTEPGCSQADPGPLLSRSTSPDLGYAAWRLRTPGAVRRDGRGRHGLSGILPRRRALVCAGLILAVAVLLVLAIGYGSFPLGPGRVLGALTGLSEDPQARLLVVQWRLPRALFAVLAGVALALSGAIFQSLTRNPLGSPDIIGFHTGSYTGAIIVMLLLGSTRYADIAAGAILGGMLTAGAVYALAWRRGSAGSFRLIIIGIGVGALLSSVNSGLMLSVSVESAMLAAVWAAGSLASLGHAQLWPTAALLALLLLATWALSNPLRQLELGDDAATSMGVRTGWTRAGLVLLGVTLTALITAAAGPISFVALAAPQIARRLVRGTGPELIASACVGALVLLAADLIGQIVDYPVGVVTVVVGGGYLVWLLATELRRRA